MPEIFGKSLSCEELRKYTGDMRQIGGLERFELQEGMEKGVEAVRIRSGAGLDLTLLPGRGLDIADAAYKGISLVWMSPTGRINPAFYEARDLGWLRGFAGGLMVTCGLNYVGDPGTDEGEEFGLHGRYSYLPASHVCLQEEWRDGDYWMEVSGHVRQSVVFGENLDLLRHIRVRLGEPAVEIEDVVTNLAQEASEFMILYHMNFGFPLLMEGTRLYSASSEIIPRDEDARRGLKEYDTVLPPTAGFAAQVFYHRSVADGAGYAHALLANSALNGGEGLAMHLSYDTTTLPWMVQWRMCNQGHYVMGLEPSNCFVRGRAEERAAGRLQMLQPGESRRLRLRVGVLSSRQDIDRIKDMLAALEK